MVKCKHGKLKTPVINADGKKRYCKLKKKSSLGISRDRKKKSKEAHEIKYRKQKRISKSKKRK